ncbi:unnamed protein product [Porites lobata]|uniref:G-protein coupled receptors family 1 profile domain-containing protein n=1 Tax=Porites lobata TaxID=104759 RepID=A0ABN8P7U7_9CNID|nr:unnamed protein product [Porites lobata]
MALKNFTEVENHKTVQELFCSAEFVRGVESELLLLSALNIFLSITAFLGNTLILVALHKENSLYPPSKLLYSNLAITDLCVGITSEPLVVTYWISVVKERWDICYYTIRGQHFSATVLCSVSLLTLTAISLDRLLALFLGLRYRPVVTLKKTRLTAVYSALWVQVTLVLCYLPHGIVFILAVQRGISLSVHLALRWTLTLVYLNSSLNPLLYCWKIREVRQAVKGILRQVFC